MIPRRSFLAAGIAVVSSACRKQRGDGFAGYAFVANQEGRAVAAVDLTAFAVARHIRLPGAPTAVVADPPRPFVYALTPDTGTLHEIDMASLKVSRTLDLGGPVWSMRQGPGDSGLWVISRERRRLVHIDLAHFRADAGIPLPESPVDFDISEWFDLAAVSFGEAGSVSIVDLKQRKVHRPTPIRGEAGLVRFRGDGRMVLAANRSERMLTALNAPEGRVMVHLPLAVRPDHFCFHPNGGQLFITGEGRDAVVIVHPYWAPEVAETVLAGSRPGAMAASQSFLFVTNPAAGDVSIMNIARRKVVAVTAVGAQPEYVTLTPDGEYALVLNQQSGDMAVIRIAGLQPDRRKMAALFTMIPVGSKPVSVVVAAV